MPKRKKPYPKFIVFIDNGKFFHRAIPTSWTIKEKLSQAYYWCDRSEIFFFKNLDLDIQLRQCGFRRPTQTELLLFEAE